MRQSEQSGTNDQSGFFWGISTPQLEEITRGSHLICLNVCSYGHNSGCNYWSNLGSVHQVPIMAGWTEAVWTTKFALHFYTRPALGIKPQTFWSWVQRPIDLATWQYNKQLCCYCAVIELKVKYIIWYIWYYTANFSTISTDHRGTGMWAKLYRWQLCIAYNALLVHL